MSVTKRAITFLAITFAISWTALIVGWLRGQDLRTYSVGGFMVLGPLVASLACVMAFEKGRRIEALGLRFKPNWWWLAALLLALAVILLAIALTILLSDSGYVPIGEGFARARQAEGQEIPQGQNVYTLLASLIGLTWIQGFISLTPTEEMGWRGYLYHLWRPYGFWRASYGAGFVQGFWHLPVYLLLVVQTPDHPWIGAAVGVISITLMGPLFTLMRERGRSILAAGIFHATWNAVAVAFVMVGNPTSWSILAGLIAVLTLVNLAIFLLRLDRPREDSQLEKHPTSAKGTPVPPLPLAGGD